MIPFGPNYPDKASSSSTKDVTVNPCLTNDFRVALRKLGKRKRDTVETIDEEVDHFEGESKTQATFPLSSYLKGCDSSFVNQGQGERKSMEVQVPPLCEERDRSLSFREKTEDVAHSHSKTLQQQKDIFHRFTKRSKHSKNGHIQSVNRKNFGSLDDATRKREEGTTTTTTAANVVDNQNNDNNCASASFKRIDSCYYASPSLHNRQRCHSFHSARDHLGEEEIEDEEEDYLYEEDLEELWTGIGDQSRIDDDESNSILQKKEVSSLTLENERFSNPDFFQKLVLVDRNNERFDNKVNDGMLFTKRTVDIHSLPLSSGELRLHRDLKDCKDLKILSEKFNVEIDKFIVQSPSTLEIHLKGLSNATSTSASTITFPSTLKSSSASKSAHAASRGTTTTSTLNQPFPTSFLIEISPKYPYEAPRLSVMENEKHFHGHYPYINNAGIVTHPLVNKEWTGICTLLTIINLLGILKRTDPFANIYNIPRHFNSTCPGIVSGSGVANTTDGDTCRGEKSNVYEGNGSKSWSMTEGKVLQIEQKETRKNLASGEYDDGKARGENSSSISVNSNSGGTRKEDTQHYDYLAHTYVPESELDAQVDNDHFTQRDDLVSSSTTLPSTYSLQGQRPLHFSTVESISRRSLTSSSSSSSPTSSVSSCISYSTRGPSNGIGASSTTRAILPHSSLSQLPSQLSTETNQTIKEKTTHGSSQIRNQLSLTELMKEAGSHIRENNIIMNNFRQRYRYREEPQSISKPYHQKQTHYHHQQKLPHHHHQQQLHLHHQQQQPLHHHHQQPQELQQQNYLPYQQLQQLQQSQQSQEAQQQRYPRFSNGQHTNRDTTRGRRVSFQENLENSSTSLHRFNSGVYSYQENLQEGQD